MATLAPAVSGDGAAPAATETEEVRPTLAAEASGDGGEGSGMRFEGRSNWIHNDDDRRFSMDVDGEVQFSRDGNRIESMSPGTTLSLRDRQGGHDRRLEVIADDNGLPSYEYRVNGREEPFEPDGRVFLEETVQELSRRHEDARLRRAEAAERRAEAAERRAEMMVQRDEARRYRDEIVRAEREMSREMRSQSEELRREVYEMDSELRRQDRERAMAYREAARELQSAQRQEDMDMRRQLREDQVDVQREASEAFRQAEIVNSSAAFQTSLNNCRLSDCRHENAAQSKMATIRARKNRAEAVKALVKDDEAYGRAMTANTAAAYQSYLNNCNPGPCSYKKKAHYRLAAAEACCSVRTPI